MCLWHFSKKSIYLPCFQNKKNISGVVANTSTSLGAERWLPPDCFVCRIFYITHSKGKYTCYSSFHYVMSLPWWEPVLIVEHLLFKCINNAKMKTCTAYCIHQHIWKNVIHSNCSIPQPLSTHLLWIPMTCSTPFVYDLLLSN